MGRNVLFSTLLMTAMVSAGAAADEQSVQPQALRNLLLSMIDDLERCQLIGPNSSQGPMKTAECQRLATEMTAVRASKVAASQAASFPQDQQTKVATPLPTQAIASKDAANMQSDAEKNRSYLEGELTPTLAGRSTYTKGSSIDVQATNQNSQVAVSVKKDLPAGATNGNSSDAFVATFAAPISKTDSSTTNIATLDGLANAFKVTLGFQRAVMRFKPIFQEDAQPTQDFIDRCRSVNLDPDPLQLNKSKRCMLTNVSGTPGYLTLLPALVETSYFYGVTITGGYETGTYYNQQTLAKSSNIDSPWDVGGYFALFRPKTGDVYQVGADIQHAYKAQDTKTRCSPPAGQPTEQCVTGSYGRPAMTVKQLVYLEWRKRFEMTVPFAVDAKLTHDFKTGDNGIDIPIFFILDSKLQLTSGVRLGWTNTDHFSAGVFVGTPFSLMPSSASASPSSSSSTPH